MKGSFRDLLDAAPDAMIVVNSDGKIMLVNTQAEKLFGYQRNELLDQTIEILIPRQFRKQHHGHRDQFAAHPHARPMGGGVEFVALRKDGSEFPADIKLSPIETEEGVVVVSSVRDITDRKHNEEIARQNAELKIKMAEENAELAAAKLQLQIVAGREETSRQIAEQKMLLQSILDSCSDAVIVADASGKVILRNPQGVRYKAGTAADDLNEKYPELAGLYKSDCKTLFKSEELPLRHALAGKSTEALEMFVRPPNGGEPRWMLAAGAPLLNTTGEKQGGVVFLRDISVQKRLEQQLRQAQKMEAVGQLAGGIAHDFNNLLAVIIGYGEILEERLNEDDPLRAKAGQITAAGKRAAALTRQLLAFSRQQVLEPKILDLSVVVSDTTRMLQRLIGEDIELVTRVAPELGRVKVDRGQIEQVIMNLAVNGRDAMPQGGKLIIATANVELDDAYVHQHPGAVAGSHVMLAVSDTGCGMDQETQAHIFEPFFTTKGLGKGTGLGLSTVYGVVKQSGGYVSVYSELGRGTSFKIYFPRNDDPVASVPDNDGSKTTQGWETVLLVEDAQPVRELARELLEGNGYTVVEAGNGADAIRVAEKLREPIHLLLTDVVMPGVGGRELADYIAGIHPEIKVLYMSGFTDDIIVHRGVLDSGVSLLEKPFTKESLIRKVREVLRTSEGSKLEACSSAPEKDQ